MVAAVAGAACGTHRSRSFASRFVKPPVAGQAKTEPIQFQPASLEEYMRKLRHLAAEARPRQKSVLLPTIETSDKRLGAALFLSAAVPTAESPTRAFRRGFIAPHPRKSPLRAPARLSP